MRFSWLQNTGLIIPGYGRLTSITFNAITNHNKLLLNDHKTKPHETKAQKPEKQNPQIKSAEKRRETPP
jgi:hypothetical protein